MTSPQRIQRNKSHFHAKTAPHKRSPCLHLPMLPVSSVGTQECPDVKCHLSAEIIISKSNYFSPDNRAVLSRGE